MISMPCVLLIVLPNEYCYRYQNTSYRFLKDISINVIYEINTTTRFFPKVLPNVDKFWSQHV